MDFEKIGVAVGMILGIAGFLWNLRNQLTGETAHSKQQSRTDLQNDYDRIKRERDDLLELVDTLKGDLIKDVVRDIIEEVTVQLLVHHQTIKKE